MQTPPFQEILRGTGFPFDDSEEAVRDLKEQCLGAKFRLVGAAGVSGDLFLVHLGNCEIDLAFTFFRNHDEKAIRNTTWQEENLAFGEAQTVPLSVWAKRNRIGVRCAEQWLQEQSIQVVSLPAVRYEKFVPSDLEFTPPEQIGHSVTQVAGRRSRNSR